MTTPAEQRLRDLLVTRGRWPEDATDALLDLMRSEGFALTDTRRDEFPVRWVSVAEREVPPEADTIIRTLTRTIGMHTDRGQFWLEGLRGPKF